MSAYPVNFVDEEGNPVLHHDSANNINYDNTDSGLSATNVQDAIDELKEGQGGGGTTPIPLDLSELVEDVEALDTRVDELEDQVNAQVEDLTVAVGRGTFQQAYDHSLVASSDLFMWLLEDTDDDGRDVKKIVWHVGNGEFIDALGARVLGELEGLTIITSASTTVTINGTSIELSKGTNNFAASALPLSSGKITSMSFGNKGSILDVDFGGIKVQGTLLFGNDGDNPVNQFSSLRSVRRMNVCGGIGKCFRYNRSVQYIHMYSESKISFNLQDLFRGTTNLRYLDIKDLKLELTRADFYFSGCGASVYDIRNFDIHGASTIDYMFSGSAVKTIIIGSDFKVSSSCGITGVTNSTPGNLVIVCVSTVPPTPMKDWFPTGMPTKGVWTLKVPRGCTDDYTSAWSFLTSQANAGRITIEEFDEGEY